MAQSTNRRMAGWLVVFFGGLFGVIFLSSYMEKHENFAWVGPATVIGLFVFLFGNLALMVWFGKRDQRQYGHRCPSCGKPLIGLSAQVAIATGNCGHCGESVFFETKTG